MTVLPGDDAAMGWAVGVSPFRGVLPVGSFGAPGKKR